MPIWDFSDFAEITHNARRITPRHNRNVSISVDRDNLYINENSFPNHAGSTGQIIQCSGTGMHWVDPESLGVGATGLPGATGAFGGPPGVTGMPGAQGYTGLRGMTGSQGTTGSQGSQGITGLANFYQKTDFNGIALVPALMWNFKDETFYGYVTGLGGKWVQVSAGAQVGATGLRGYTGIQGVTGLVGVTGAYGGPQGATGIQGATGSGGSGGSSVNILGTTGVTSYPGGMTGTIPALSFDIKQNKRYLVEAFIYWSESGYPTAYLGLTGPQVTSIKVAYRGSNPPFKQYTGYTGIFSEQRVAGNNEISIIKMNINAGSATGIFSFIVKPASGSVEINELCTVTIKEI